MRPWGRAGWSGEHASADGFFFALHSSYNLVKDCEAIDCSRWDFVPTENVRNSTFVDCRGGDLNIRSFGFIDVESAGPANSLIRCRSPNSQLIAQQHFQNVIGCTASAFIVEHASYPRLLACTTVGGTIRACEVRDNRFVTAGRESPMLTANRIFMTGASPDHSLTIVCNDGLGRATGNVLYGFEDGDRRSTEMLLFGVGSQNGNHQTWGRWDEPLGQFVKPYYLRAHFDRSFKKKAESSAD